MFRGLINGYVSLLQRRPFLVNSVTCSVVVGAGDAIAQTVEFMYLRREHEKQHLHCHTTTTNTNINLPATATAVIPSSVSPSSPTNTVPIDVADCHEYPGSISDHGIMTEPDDKFNFDSYRFTSLTCWGLASGGIVGVWYRMLDRRIPYKTPAMIALKIAINQTTFAVLCNALFFVWCVGGKTLLDHNTRKEFIPQSIAKLQSDLWPTTIRSVTIWSVIHSFNFAFIPPHLRVLYQSCMSVPWMSYLSIIGHKKHDIEEQSNTSEHVYQSPVQSLQKHNNRNNSDGKSSPSGGVSSVIPAAAVPTPFVVHVSSPCMSSTSLTSSNTVATAPSQS